MSPPTRDLLARLAEHSSYGAIDGPDAVHDGRPLADPRALVDHVATHLGTTDRMVAASVAFQAVTSRAAVAVVVANESLGRSLALPLAGLRWRVVDGQVRLALTEVGEGPALAWPELVDQLVAATFEPWVEAMRSHERIGRRLLWGNAADSLAGAMRSLPGLHRADVTAALAALPVPHLMVVRPAGQQLRRTTCCLIDKVPGYGRCEQCSLPTRGRGS